MSTPLYELGFKCPHMQFLGRGQMSEGANVWLQSLCSENKGADLRLCFRICKKQVFSRGLHHMLILKSIEIFFVFILV